MRNGSVPHRSVTSKLANMFVQHALDGLQDNPLRLCGIETSQVHQLASCILANVVLPSSSVARPLEAFE